MSSNNAQQTHQIKVVEENPRPYISYIPLDYLSLPDRELKVWLALKSFAWNHKDNCYPSIDTVAERAGKKRTQIKQILNLLEHKGLIRIEYHEGFNNVYYITNKELSDNKTHSKSYTQPSRKTDPPPVGKPPTPQSENRPRSNISNNIKEKERETAKSSEVSQRISLSDFDIDKFTFNDKEMEIAKKSELVNSPILMKEVLKKFILNLESKGRNSFMRQELQIWLTREVEYHARVLSKGTRSSSQGSIIKPNETKCAIPFYKPDSKEVYKASPETISHYMNEIKSKLGIHKPV